MEKQENPVRGKEMPYSGYCKPKWNSKVSLIFVIIFIIINFISPLYGVSTFLDSHFNFSFALGLDFESNDIIKEDEKVTHQYFQDKHFSYSTTVFHAGFEMDMYSSPLNYGKSFLLPIKLGACFTYKGYSINQTISTSGSDGYERDFEGVLLDYNVWQIGPIIYLNIIHHDVIDLAVVTFTVYGKLQGNLTAAPGLRDMGVNYSDNEYKTHIHGNKFTIGIGLNFALNKWVPIYGGYKLYYTRTEIILDNDISLYSDIGNKVLINGGGAELFVGFYL
jgi:hypothetical protein